MLARAKFIPHGFDWACPISCSICRQREETCALFRTPVSTCDGCRNSPTHPHTHTHRKDIKRHQSYLHSAFNQKHIYTKGKESRNLQTLKFPKFGVPEPIQRTPPHCGRISSLIRTSWIPVCQVMNQQKLVPRGRDPAP